MKRIVGWAVAGAVAVIAAVSGALFAGHVNERADEDAPLARAECAEHSGASEFRLEWTSGLKSGWECSWLSGDDHEGGGFFIAWNAYADR